MDTVEPEWIEMTTFWSNYDEQVDVNAHPRASAGVKYRHRARSYTGERQGEWMPGPAPRK